MWRGRDINVVSSGGGVKVPGSGSEKETLGSGTNIAIQNQNLIIGDGVMCIGFGLTTVVRRGDISVCKLLARLLLGSW